MNQNSCSSTLQAKQSQAGVTAPVVTAQAKEKSCCGANCKCGSLCTCSTCNTTKL